MKKTLYIISVLVFVLFAAACESGIQPDEEFDGESAVCFMPMLSDASTVMPDTDPASRTKAADLVSADGSISLALGYEVCEGIADQARNDADRHAELDDADRHAELDSASDSASPETKGTQLNTTGSDAALGNYSISQFKVAAWKGSGSLIPANTVVTKGTDVWTTSTPYYWGASQTATFYAYANLPSSGASVSCASSSKQTLSYTALPTTAAAQNDILLGFYTGTGRYDATIHKGGIADVKFYHPLTAVQFKLGTIAGATTVSVTKISISKVHAGGTADMTAPATGSTVPEISWTPSGITTVTIGDGTSALAVDSSKGNLIGDQPFILIPQVLTTSPVTVTVDFSIDGTPTTLAAKINTGEWKAGKTNIYTLGYDSKSFTLSGPDDFNFFNTAATSDDSQTIDCYVKDATTGTQTAGDYYLEYSTDGGESYSSTSPDWVSVSVGNGTNGKDRQMTVSVTELTSYTETNVQAALKSYPEKTDFDLSKFNPATGAACETTTANTYVVNAPGTYRFPVVYGNALKNGTTNSAAYHPQTGSNQTMNASGSSGNNYYLRYFLDYKDQTITQPYILHSKTGQYTVGTLWSDIQNLVTNVALEGSGDDAYISFTVAKSTINEGNAVIYLADPSGDIVWSWQIWVSAVDASKTIPIKNLAGGSHDFMTYHLGWESSVNAVIKLPTPRTVKVRMVMTYDGNVKDSKEFNVTQSGIGSYKDPTDGRCTYYQWGRKDPLIPGGCRTVYNIKSGVTPLVTTTSGGRSFQSVPVNHASSSTEAGVTIGTTIQHPWIHYCSYWMAPTKYDITNLWNGNATSRGYTGETLKTVYDPSPVGFVVPPSDAYTAFTVDGESNGDVVSKINADTTLGFDPASATGTGWRFYTQGWKTGPTVSFTIKGNRFSQDGIWANTIGADKPTTEDQGRLWTSGPTHVSGSSNVVAVGLIYHHTWVKPKQQLDEADGTSIRCVKETL